MPLRNNFQNFARVAKLYNILKLISPLSQLLINISKIIEKPTYFFLMSAEIGKKFLKANLVNPLIPYCSALA